MAADQPRTCSRPKLLRDKRSNNATRVPIERWEFLAVAVAAETVPCKKLAPLPVIWPPRWLRKEKATIAKGYANPIGDVHVEFPSPTPIASRPA